MYSASKFTNWAPHDLQWAEVHALPDRMRMASSIERSGADPLPIYVRRLSPGFLRPFSVDDVVAVLSAVPAEFLTGLMAVVLLGGTTRQLRLRSPAYGMYDRGRIFLCALPRHSLSQDWEKAPKPSVARRYTKFGARFLSFEPGGATLVFDETSLHRFYLYDVLLHELGHHVDEGRGSADVEHYAHWFADFQEASLRSAMRDSQD